jgi:molecular chaperone HscB
MSDSLFSKNYFEIFALDVSSSVDMSQLKQKNQALQQQVHPDRFASGSDADKREAMQKTSLVNQAYNTLKEPASRLQYMLSLKGIDMSAETDTTMDGAFLMEQMELREAIAEVRDKADPLDALDKIASQLKQKATQLLNEFDQSYDRNAFDEAREVVRKLQFINKAQREVSELTEQLEDEIL